MTNGSDMVSQIKVMLDGVCDHAPALVFAVLEERAIVRDGLETGEVEVGGLNVGTGVERDDLVGEAVGSGKVDGWLRVET